MKILTSSLQQSLKSCPFVFKNINLYFGFYFIGLSIVFLFVLAYFLPSEEELGFSPISSNLLTTALISLSKAFTVFMVPYYTYKHSKSSDVRPFWTFISETVWPLVWNHIKGAFIILFFTLFLFIPGIYKCIRYTFISQTVFFDDLYKQDQVSVLKGTDKTSRGYFWLIVLFLLFSIVLFILPQLLFPFLDFFPIHSPIKNGLNLIFNFYLSCFVFLFQSQLYFELKKQRGESISC